MQSSGYKEIRTMRCTSCGFGEQCPPYDRCDEMERQAMDAMIAEHVMEERYNLPDKNDISYWL